MTELVKSVLGRIHQRIFGLPFVYDHIRPLAVGGIDMSPVYSQLEAGPADVVLDVGCGTADALEYLGPVKAYHGFDTDPVAIARARKRAAERGVPARFEARLLEKADLDAVAPTKVVLAGLLHHLSDTEARSLLAMLGACPSVQRVVTTDVVFLPGRTVSNLLASLDRGRHVRREPDYPALVAGSGLTVTHTRLLRCHPRRGLAMYLSMTLEPESR